MPSPYIGVTGFMRGEEVAETLIYLPDKSSYQIKVGVFVSDKTLRGETNRHPTRFPKIEVLKSIFIQDPKVINLVHFNTHDPGRLKDDLIWLTEDYGGPHMHGFQLNLTWPSVRDLMIYHQICSPKRTVLKIGNKAMEEIGHSPETLRERVGRYVGVVTDVIIDPSGGAGQPFEPMLAREYLHALQGCGVRVGVAGGLEAQRLHQLVRPLAQEFPGLSIEADGKLRDPQDNLDILAAGRYIREAAFMFERLEEDH